MRYYKLIYDYEQDDNYANCDVASIGNMDEYITISGKEIKQWGRVVFEYDSTEGNVLTDYLANPHRWFVVSENFCNKTQKILENQVQFLPVKVIDRFSGIDSLILARETVALVQDAGYCICNIDSTLIAQAPKLSPYLPQMRKALSQALQINTNQINIKATTEEHLGFTGRKEGIAAHAFCLLERTNQVQSLQL